MSHAMILLSLVVFSSVPANETTFIRHPAQMRIHCEKN